MKTISELYERANKLGEVMNLQFWIVRHGYGPENKVCGEVIIWNDRDSVPGGATICDLPYGVEHDHQPCVYCLRIASHFGEGELVCKDHIPPESIGEYTRTYEDLDTMKVGDIFTAANGRVYEVSDVYPDGYRVSEL